MHPATDGFPDVRSSTLVPLYVKQRSFQYTHFYKIFAPRDWQQITIDKENERKEEIFKKRMKGRQIIDEENERKEKVLMKRMKGIKKYC